MLKKEGGCTWRALCLFERAEQCAQQALLAGMMSDVLLLWGIS
jgi:hypothetical protein